MAKNIYVGVGGKARHVKALYVGVGGKARKVKKVYVGVGGKARLAYQAYIPVTSIKLSSWSAQRNGEKSSVGIITCYFDIQPSNATNPSINTISIENPSDRDGEGCKTKLRAVSGNGVLFNGAYETGSYSAKIKIQIDDAVCNLTFNYHSKALFINFRYYVDVVQN